MRSRALFLTLLLCLPSLVLAQDVARPQAYEVEEEEPGNRRPDPPSPEDRFCVAHTDQGLTIERVWVRPVDAPCASGRGRVRARHQLSHDPDATVRAAASRLP